MLKKRGASSDMLISLELERSKLNREKSVILLDKALLLYFSFLFVGIIGFINGYMQVKQLNMLILMSFGVLIVGIAPYWITMKKEEERINDLILSVNKRGGKNA